MDKRFSSSNRLLNRAFTLIELMVVMAVIGILAMISLYGYRNFDTQQSVQTAQKDFINNFRSVQNRVNSGNGGNVINLSFNANGYSFSGQTTALPSGVSVTISTYDYGSNSWTELDSNLYTCVPNQNLTTYDSSINVCGKTSVNCSGNDFIACYTGINPAVKAKGPIRITFSKNSYIKVVQIEGSGMRITRVYEP